MHTNVHQETAHRAGSNVTLKQMHLTCVQLECNNACNTAISVLFSAKSSLMAHKKVSVKTI